MSRFIFMFFLMIVVAAAATTTIVSAFTPSANPTMSTCPFLGPAGAQLSCANLQLPAQWGDAAKTSPATVTVAVSRLSAVGIRKGAVTFLNGGSGVASECMVNASWLLPLTQLGFDLLLIDMRGSGRCTPRLDCPGSDFDMPDVKCAEYFKKNFGAQGMFNFSITQAADDVAYIFEKFGANKSKGEKNVLLSNSFGTFWAQRTLLRHPTLFDNVFFDSFDAPGTWKYFDSIGNMQHNTNRLLTEYCSNDLSCAGKLGGGKEAWRVAVDVIMGKPAATCAAALAKTPPTTSTRTIKMTEREWRQTFKVMMASLMGGASREPLGVVPSLVYRIGRCDASKDHSAIAHLYNYFMPENPAAPTRDACTISQPVLYNLFLSEGVGSNAPDKTALRAQWDSMLVAPPDMDKFIAMVDVAKAWPTYTSIDKNVGKLPKYPLDVPVLFLNGDLDGSTPFDNAAYYAVEQSLSQADASLSTPAVFQNHTIAIMKSCPHVAFLISPVPGKKITCGLEILQSFVTTVFSPAADRKIDFSCINKITKIDFNSPSLASVAYGKTDMFEFDKPLQNLPFYLPTGSSSNNGATNSSSSPSPSAADCDEKKKLYLALLLGALGIVVISVILNIYTFSRMRSQKGGNSKEELEHYATAN